MRISFKDGANHQYRVKKKSGYYVSHQDFFPQGMPWDMTRFEILWADDDIGAIGYSTMTVGAPGPVEKVLHLGIRIIKVIPRNR